MKTQNSPACLSADRQDRRGRKLKTQNFKREFSAGCVVYKKLKAKSLPASRQGLKLKAVFLLGKHSGYHKWVLPKGLIEEGEEGWRTALRETEEEMGVKARLVDKKPIHKLQYIFYANYKPQSENFKFPAYAKATAGKQNLKVNTNTRRVKKYQEKGGKKVKVFKTVTFYLAEYVSGNPKDHGWEMEEAGWFDYDKALKLMAFEGEKEALGKAKKILKEGTQESLF